MSFTTNLWAFTLALRDQFPTAGELRFRKAVKPHGVVYQLVGNHPRAGKIARQVAARTEAEVLSAGVVLMNELDMGLRKGTVLTGSNRGLAQAVIQNIQTQGLRDATEDARIRRVREVIGLLEERSLKANQFNLRTVVEELAPVNNRRRRSICTAARDVARAAKVELDLSGLFYTEPPPRKLVEVEDDVLFRRLDQHLPKVENEGAVWVLRMVAITGIRGNGCLSLDRTAFDLFEGGNAVEWKMSDRIRYWDSKRGRPAFASQTIRDWYQHWDLWNYPRELDEYWMPCDQEPSNDALERVNKLLNNYSSLLRRKVHREASKSIGFRALRHAATARLLKAGLSLLDVAEITSSSVTEIESRYSDMFRETSARRAAELL